MKATVDIPEDLYRQVKAKSALKGMAVREVVVHLFESWISEADDTASSSSVVKMEKKPPSWFGMARQYADKVEHHDMNSIRKSISHGRHKELSRASKATDTPS